METPICKQTLISNICCLFEQNGILITQQRLSIINMVCSKVLITDLEREWVNLRLECPVSWASMWATMRLMQKLDLLITQKNGHCKKQFLLNVAVATSIESTISKKP